MGNFKWLHLSDFHIGRDDYGQLKLLSYIIDHIKEIKKEGIIPDAIFITGDIANKGLEEQYNIFFEEFLIPLSYVFEKMPKVYIIPGNHDLNREKCTIAADSLYDILTKKSYFFDPNEKGFCCRKEIFDRFQDFRNCLESFGEDLCFSVKEMFGEKGCFTDVISIENKKIGIIGLNTAWLSKSDEDREKLTPGKYILEEAFDTVKDCDFKIVLGHHPLDWLQGEQRQQISTLLEKNKAIYLHGHLHKNCGGYSAGYNSIFLTLQSGAAFQERENEEYYNSLQWGELLLGDNKVRVIPKKWSLRGQRFIADSSERMPETFRESGRDSWLFPYTLSIFDEKAKEGEEPKIKVPTGWVFIDRSFKNTRKEPSSESILKYFDGKEPSYNDIFSSFIPERDIVDTIKREFVKCNEENKTKCVLITGAGGEGKTTVLLQTVRRLVEENDWHALVLRQVEKDMKIQETQIFNFTKEGNWVICVDNCFPVSEKLFKLLVKLKNRKEQHVHLLLCARDIDWNNNESGKLAWGDYSDYHSFKLRGINEGDAEKIVIAWKKFGDKGMGKLKDLSVLEAKQKLYLSARDEELKIGPEEGALLGAMLTTRHGEELNNHVHNMLLRLQDIKVGNDSLLDAFAYIVAMHSEKLYFLSKAVIAQLYHYKLKDVKKYILGPLGDEAASAVSGDLIYTRHILIAQSARRILDREFHYDFDEIFIELTIAAVEAKKNGEFIESFAKWKFISDYFMKENHSLAIRLDKSILKVDRYDPYMIVHLSRLYRDVEEYEMATELFRDVDYEVDHRSFFCEWALTEANVDNKAASVCLSALALSDNISKKRIKVIDACINLYSIARTFYELYLQYKKDNYLRASLSAIKLGERIDKDHENIKKFIKHELPKFDKKIVKENLKYDKCLQKEILAVSQDSEENFKDWIPQIETLEYKYLFSLAGILIE